MTTPTIAEIVSNSPTLAGTSQDVVMPATVNAGDLLFIATASDGNRTLTEPSGFTNLLNQGNTGGVTLGLFYKQAAGTEGGSTLTVGVSASEFTSSVVFRITGHENPATQAPELANSSGNENSTSPDPPNLTPTGGPKDFLYLAISAHDTYVSSTTGYPAGYSNTGTEFFTPGSTCTVSWATLSTTGTSSENPGTFTISTAEDWVTATIAIHPAGVAGPVFTSGPTVSGIQGSTATITTLVT